MAAILCKPQWWLKWRGVVGADGEKAVADKWLDEVVRVVVRNRFRWMSTHWRCWFMDFNEDYQEQLLQRLVHFPPFDGDKNKRQQQEHQQQCSSRARIAYEYFWEPEAWPEELSDDESSDDESLDDESWDDDHDEDFPACCFFENSAFRTKVDALDSTSVLCWYFAVLALSQQIDRRSSTEWPRGATVDLGDESVCRRAIDLIKAAYDGDVTKACFTTLYPDADDRPQAVDLIWFHVERAVHQVKSVRTCVRATLDDLIDRHDLMNPASVDGFISPGPVIETWMSDSIVPEDVKAKFVREVAVLEDVPEHEKDWHPGSNQQVLDLVHPSLYCCVLRETNRVREDQLTFSAETSLADRMQQLLNAELEIVGSRSKINGSRSTSDGSSYQWIPSDFHIDAEGRAKILSYINNLHPGQHEAMYQSIESIFSKFVPMFDRVLGWLAQPNEPVPSLDGENDRSRYQDEAYYCAVPLFPDLPSRLALGMLPPSPFTICGSTVQVITKIAEIHLTPENPTYRGGSWHIEGTDTENIVANRHLLLWL
ncbi:hypothetical protein PINS_up005826 [Pythium insidiosum]|nr:hypothetical protein PINS_up005826 [Pythium insidiosum]